MVYLLPLYHPIRLAEEIAMLDQLGRGRLDVGVGRGRSPVELESFGLDPAASEALFDEVAGNHAARAHRRRGDVCREALQRQGRAALTARATRNRIRRYGMGSARRPASTVASHRDFNAITIAKPDVAKETASKYFEAAAAAGLDLTFGVCRFVVVADTTDEALAIARRAYPYWHKSFVYLFALHGIRPVQAWPGDFDAMVDLGLAFAGSPDDLAEVAAFAPRPYRRELFRQPIRIW